jgi:hypothetical protein
MTAHAIEEMAEDGLAILDIEQAALSGHVVEIQNDDPRGNKNVLRATTKTAQRWSAWLDGIPAGNGT